MPPFARANPPAQEVVVSIEAPLHGIFDFVRQHSAQLHRPTTAHLLSELKCVKIDARLRFSAELPRELLDGMFNDGVTFDDRQ
ncbi:hypothetical protein JCM10207_006797 [Rhodosporidiobolus poonsookiae]